MNQIPNIEETEQPIDAAATNQWPRRFLSRGTKLGLGDLSMMVGVVNEIIQAQRQKAREEERERIEAVFKEHVPPHAMDLEDSVWLKRLLNKAFNHDKNI